MRKATYMDKKTLEMYDNVTEINLVKNDQYCLVAQDT